METKKKREPMKPVSFAVDSNVVKAYGDEGFVAYLKKEGIMFSKFMSFILENPKLVELIVDCIPMNDDYRTKAWLKEHGKEENIKTKVRDVSENEELSKLLQNIRNMNK